jgi:hypothetical protein
MRINNWLTAVIVCCAILAPVVQSVTEATARTKRVHHRLHDGGRVQRSAGCPVHSNAYGELIDCHGWRKWSGSIGWDNTCFKSLDHLPGQYACSTGDSRR